MTANANPKLFNIVMV